MTNRLWVTLLYFFARYSHQSCLIPWPTASEWCCFISLPGTLISYVLYHDEQLVSDTALFLCQKLSSIMSCPMTNREWVTLLYFFARHCHQSCLIPWPTGSECQWHCFIARHSHPMTNSEWVTLLYCQVLSSIMSHSMTNRLWVTLLYCQVLSLIMSGFMTNRLWVTLLYFFARHCHQSCLIPWSTGCEWYCFISLPGTLINPVSSNDQQQVSDTALFLCQALSSIMSHPVTNREWVMLLYFFARQSHQCLISWPTESEWHCFISSPSSLMSHPMTNSEWVTIAGHSHQSCLIPWPTACEWLPFISLPGTLISNVLSNDLQVVSDIALFLCQPLSSIMLCPMTNRKWVTLLYLSTREAHQSCLIPWPTACEWHCFISLQSSFIHYVSISLPITWPTDCKSYEVF